MNSFDWWQLITASVLIIIGWFIGHRLSSYRDNANKRREIQINALRSIYMKLSMASENELTEKICEDIETAVAEIQLYGGNNFTKLISDFVEDYKTKKWISYSPLLRELRDEIRREMRLEKLENEVWWIRFPKGLK